MFYYFHKSSGEYCCDSNTNLCYDTKLFITIQSDVTYSHEKLIIVDGNIVDVNNVEGDDDIQIVETLNSFSELQLDLMETMAELNEALLSRATSTESEV